MMRTVETVAAAMYEALTGSIVGFGNDQRLANILRELARAQLEKENG
jgi:hypothetical protein